MKPEFKLSIIIPCYNEEKKLTVEEYSKFIKDNQDALLLFVNDGSTDSTIEKIKQFKTLHPENINYKSLEKNVGKAEAVRIGINECYDNYSTDYLAYLDADLAVSLEECKSLSSQLDEDIEFCFGSRIKLLGSQIDRKTSRFFIGRFIATIISLLLAIDVYDTQCGCKVFKRELVPYLYKKRFISRWLFDVEIFFRLIELFGREKIDEKLKEIPLNRWIEKGDSKVKATYFFNIWFDLIKIRKEYR